jgi:hypothetical protein
MVVLGGLMGDLVVPPSTYTLFDNEAAPLVLSYTASAKPLPYSLCGGGVSGGALSCGDEVDIEQLDKRLKISNRVFGVSLTIGTVGIITAGVGAGMVIIGIFPALFGEPALLLAGSVIAGVGAGVAVVALPVAVTGAFMGNAALRQAGIPTSSIPGWLAVAGLGGTVIGLAIDNGGLVLGGLGVLVSASITQAIVTNRSFSVYKRQLETPEQASVSLHPYVSQDGYGLGLSGRF